MDMKRFKLIFLFSVIVLFFILELGLACTTFNLQGKDFNLVGHNYDWPLGDGLVFVNKSGISKVAMLAYSNKSKFQGRPAQWTSKYGSVTFNQYGCEFAHGGMNEAGLVIEAMALYKTIYPKPDSRPFIHRSQWAQYQLDNFETVEEVINNDSKIRISPVYSGPGTHFLISDRVGNCATIEFLNGEMVVHSGSKLPVRTLANDTYSESLELWEKYGKLIYNNRFIQAANSVQKFNFQTLDAALETSFDILHTVSQTASTQWSIVFDIKNSMIYYRTRSNPRIRHLDLKKFDFSCKTPIRLLDINDSEAGNITDRFTEYSFQIHENLIKTSFGKLRLVSGFQDNDFTSYFDTIVRYPDTTICQDAQ